MQEAKVQLAVESNLGGQHLLFLLLNLTSSRTHMVGLESKTLHRLLHDIMLLEQLITLLLLLCNYV